MDYLKVETVSNDLKDTLDLLQLVDEENEDIFELLSDVKKAKTPAERSGAISLLLVQLENRFSIIQTLNGAITRNVDNNSYALDKLIDKELEDRKASKKSDKSIKGDANDVNSKL